MNYGVVFFWILGFYCLYYGGLVIYELFGVKKEPLEDVKQAEEEIDVSDENSNFSPTQIFVEKGSRYQSYEDELEEEYDEDDATGEDEDSEEEHGAPIQMNEGYNVNQIQEMVDNSIDPELDNQLKDITLLYNNPKMPEEATISQKTNF